MNKNKAAIFAICLSTGSFAFAAEGDTTSAVATAKDYVGGKIDEKARGFLKNLLSADRGLTEISVQGIAHGKPLWDILLLRPVTESMDSNTFVQGSLNRSGNRTTLNLGYGYRRLFNQDTVLLGANTFYDYEFPYDHQRMSIGGELRTSVGEVNANIYSGLSGWQSGADNLEEKALSGHDVEFAIALPYIPTAHLRAKAFSWNGVDGATDLKGSTYSLTGTLLPGLSIEAGRTDYSGSTRDANFIKLAYTLGGDGNQKTASVPRVTNVPWALTSMADRRFDKVRRENRIIKATRTSTFAVTVSGYGN